MRGVQIIMTYKGALTMLVDSRQFFFKGNSLVIHTSIIVLNNISNNKTVSSFVYILVNIKIKSMNELINHEDRRYIESRQVCSMVCEPASAISIARVCSASAPWWDLQPHVPDSHEKFTLCRNSLPDCIIDIAAKNIRDFCYWYPGNYTDEILVPRHSPAAISVCIL